MELLEKVTKSRKEKAIRLLKNFDADGWIVISSGNDPNFEYLLGTRVYGTSIAFLTESGLSILVSKLEESMVKMPHVDQITTYYGSKEFINGLINLISTVRGGKLLVNIAPPMLAPYASRIFYGHAKLLQNMAEIYGITLLSAHKYIWELRSVKTEAEIDALTRAVEASLDALEIVFNNTKIGMTEKEVAAELYKEIYMIGSPSFDIIVAFGENSANPHHTTSNKKLRNGEIGYIDMGIKIASMCADITRVFFTSNVNSKFRQIYEIVREAQDGSISIMRDGIPAREPDSKAREIIKNEGYNPEEVFTHGLGHPVGVEVHDVGPALSFLADPKQIIRENMTLTVEPAIYLRDEGGIRLEDDIVIKKTKAIRLSKAPEEPIRI